MNKKGASIFVVLMFALLLFFFAFAIAGALNTGVQSIRTNMACATNFSIMDYGSKVTCFVTDLYSPLFIAVIIGCAAALVAIKMGG